MLEKEGEKREKELETETETEKEEENNTRTHLQHCLGRQGSIRIFWVDHHFRLDDVFVGILELHVILGCHGLRVGGAPTATGLSPCSGRWSGPRA